jgi:hypothetical protein
MARINLHLPDGLAEKITEAAEANGRSVTKHLILVLTQASADGQFMTSERIGRLLTAAAREGIRVGKAGTDGDFTAEGIAGHVYRGDIPTQAVRED